MILLFTLLLSDELLFPGAFERPGNQPMFGLNRMILTSGSFSPLLPERIQLSSLLLYPLGSGERQFQGGWLQSSEDLLADVCI